MKNIPEKTDILLIDNGEISRNATCNVLTKAGFSVDTAQHGKEGMDRLRSSNFNYRLVITEVIMPYACGFEVIEYIRKNSAIPIIVLSGVQDENSVQAIFSLSVNDFIKKPFIAAELLQRINRVLNRSTKK